jgi:hypothetical protein
VDSTTLTKGEKVPKLYTSASEAAKSLSAPMFAAHDQEENDTIFWEDRKP